MALALQRGCQLLQLRCFSAAVKAFEGNEFAAFAGHGDAIRVLTKSYHRVPASMLRCSRAILRASKIHGGPMRLGDYIDDYCSRCKRSTDHAIVSMVGEEVSKVRCRTCDSEHNFRHNKGGKEMTAKEAFDKVLASVTGAQQSTPEASKPKRRKK